MTLCICSALARSTAILICIRYLPNVSQNYLLTEKLCIISTVSLPFDSGLSLGWVGFPKRDQNLRCIHCDKPDVLHYPSYSIYKKLTFLIGWTSVQYGVIQYICKGEGTNNPDIRVAGWTTASSMLIFKIAYSSSTKLPHPREDWTSGPMETPDKAGSPPLHLTGASNIHTTTSSHPMAILCCIKRKNIPT